MDAFAYLRVSGKGQLDGDGFPRQLEAVTSYAKANGITIVRVFREEGVSGKNDLEHRPALQELMAALELGDVTLVLIERLDRLARDLMVQETILADMQKRSLQLVSVAEPDLCSTDPSRKLVRQIFGAIAEYDRAMIVLKLKAARQRKKASNGRCEGRKPFGTFAGEPETIARMQELRAAGATLEQIARTLDSEGRRPRAGARWYANSVARILRADCAQTAVAQ